MLALIARCYYSREDTSECPLCFTGDWLLSNTHCIIDLPIECNLNGTLLVLVFFLRILKRIFILDQFPVSNILLISYSQLTLLDRIYQIKRFPVARVTQITSEDRYYYNYHICYHAEVLKTGSRPSCVKSKSRLPPSPVFHFNQVAAENICLHLPLFLPNKQLVESLIQ